MKAPILRHQLHDRSFVFKLNLCATLLIYLACEAGRALSFNGGPLEVSIVWPAAGLSLALLLLFSWRLWPAIFLGGFLSTSSNLIGHYESWLAALYISFMITSGSLLQALVGAYLMRRWSTHTYFQTVKDVVVFILWGGAITCLIASSVAIVTLHGWHGLYDAAALQRWLTFWVGDLFGIYTMTPLIMVWVLQPPRHYTAAAAREALAMVAVTGLLSWLIFAEDIPLAQLYVALCVWISYRFGMRGATLAIFVISFIAIVLTVKGVGAFATTLSTSPMPILITYLGVIVIMCLMLSAVLFERELAWQLLQSHKINLEQALKMRLGEIDKMHGDISLKEKLASLGLMALSFAKQLQSPLEQISGAAQRGAAELTAARQQLEKSVVAEKEINASRDNLVAVEEELSQVASGCLQSAYILEIIHKLSKGTDSRQWSVKLSNIQTLLNKALNDVIDHKEQRRAGFTVAVIKRFHHTTNLLPVMPEEIGHAFGYLFTYLFDAMEQQWSDRGADYTPTLLIKTKELGDAVELTLECNCGGIAESRLQQILGHETVACEGKEINLLLAHDIIVYMHAGAIAGHCPSLPQGDYLVLTIVLPKGV